MNIKCNVKHNEVFISATYYTGISHSTDLKGFSEKKNINKPNLVIIDQLGVIWASTHILESTPFHASTGRHCRTRQKFPYPMSLSDWTTFAPTKLGTLCFSHHSTSWYADMW